MLFITPTENTDVQNVIKWKMCGNVKVNLKETQEIHLSCFLSFISIFLWENVKPHIFAGLAMQARCKNYRNAAGADLGGRNSRHSR